MKYDIESLKRKMLVKYPFFGDVVANADYKETTKVLTAGTDGKVIYYNPEYFGELDLGQQIFVLAHEVCHIAFNHVLRSAGKDLKLWNVATDGVINQFLKRDGLEMPLGVIDISEAINYDAEQLYEKLLKEEQDNQDEQGNSFDQDQDQESNELDSESSLDSEQQDVGHDTHSLWEKAVKDYNEEQDKFSEDDDNSLNGEQNNVNDIQEEIKSEQEQIGERASFEKNSEYKKKQLEDLKKTIAKEVSEAGNYTDESIRTVKNIGVAKPLIDWRYVLREAINHDVDWSYMNATVEDGVVVANLEGVPVSETEILLDTSGSINEDLLKNFLKECKNILQYSRLKVGCFDTKFYGFHEIRNEEDIENMTFEGGGGTNFDVAVEAFSRRTENKIIFTDGMAPMPDMSIDAVWIVFGDKKINPDGGKVINITGEQLDRLYSYNVLKGRVR